MTMGEGKVLCVKTEESGWDKGLSWLLLPDEILEWRWLRCRDCFCVMERNGILGRWKRGGWKKLIAVSGSCWGWIVNWGEVKHMRSCSLISPHSLEHEGNRGRCGFPLGWPGALCSPCPHHVHTPHPWPPSPHPCGEPPAWDVTLCLKIKMRNPLQMSSPKVSDKFSPLKSKCLLWVLAQ